VKSKLTQRPRCFHPSGITFVMPFFALANRYDTTSKIAKESVTSGKTVRQLCEEQLDAALNPVSMT